MSSSGDNETTVRYAPYLEAAHSRMLDNEGFYWPTQTLVTAFNAAVNQSPYGTYVVPEVEDAFFGDGYTIASFPTLYDMFGKFMAALDVCDLWGLIYENVVHGPEINNTVTAQAAMLQDEIDTDIMPKFLAGMRDINSVMSSSFIVGKSIIANAHVKAINKFASELRLHAVDVSEKMWEKHLDWNKNVIGLYAEYAKLYYATRLDADKVEMEFAVKDELWNLGLFDYARSFIGAMHGAAATQQKDQSWMDTVGSIMGIAGSVMGFLA